MFIASDLLDAVKSIALEVGELILPFQGKPQRLGVTLKADNTPVTLADQAAHDHVQQALSLLSSIPVLSEEGDIPEFKQRQQWLQYWLVDPLDGTRGFIAGKDSFTVNIALIEDNRPQLGVIYVPKRRLLYWACQGGGAFYQHDDGPVLSLCTRALDWQAPAILIGHYYNEDNLRKLLAHYPGHTLQKINSSYKFALIAAAEADVYARVGPTSEWDTAAGQCILQEAGGVVVDLSGQPLQYNATESLRNPPFLALGDPAQLTRVLKLFEQEKNNYDPEMY